ncbi:MAG: TIGR02444 family protein [Geminicoccaceae bacterium]
MDRLSDPSFWQFACERYTRAGVTERLLRWQDANGIDVIEILVGLWLAERGVALDSARLGDLRSATQSWSCEAIYDFRVWRRRFKKLTALPEAMDRTEDHVSLYKRACSLELEMERLQIERTESLARTWPSTEPPSPALAEANLRRVIGDDPSGLSDIRALVMLVFERP